LGNKVRSLEEELNNIKNDFENLDIIYKNTSFKCVDVKTCENCDYIKMKVQYLKNFEQVYNGAEKSRRFTSQNYVFGKVVLGYNSNAKNNKKTTLDLL